MYSLLINRDNTGYRQRSARNFNMATDLNSFGIDRQLNPQK